MHIAKRKCTTFARVTATEPVLLASIQERIVEIQRGRDRPRPDGAPIGALLGRRGLDPASTPTQYVKQAPRFGPPPCASRSHRPNICQRGSSRIPTLLLVYAPNFRLAVCDKIEPWPLRTVPFARAFRSLLVSPSASSPWPKPKRPAPAASWSISSKPASKPRKLSTSVSSNSPTS